MCQYLKENQCSLLKNNCPWSYYCNKENKWKFKNEGVSCKVKLNAEVPKGYYKVCFERKGNLYISINNQIQVIPNPFDEVPLYVKAYRLKNGQWKLRKYEG